MQSSNWLDDKDSMTDSKSYNKQKQRPFHGRPILAAKRSSSAASFQPAVRIFQGCASEKATNDSPVQQLKDFCRRMNLEQPVFKTIPIGRSEDKMTVFNCKVQVKKLLCRISVILSQINFRLVNLMVKTHVPEMVQLKELKIMQHQFC